MAPLPCLLYHNRAVLVHTWEFRWSFLKWGNISPSLDSHSVHWVLPITPTVFCCCSALCWSLFRQGSVLRGGHSPLWSLQTSSPLVLLTNLQAPATWLAVRMSMYDVLCLHLCVSLLDTAPTSSYHNTSGQWAAVTVVFNDEAALRDEYWPKLSSRCWMLLWFWCCIFVFLLSVTAGKVSSLRKLWSWKSAEPYVSQMILELIQF